MSPQIPIDRAQIEQFCHKWKITEFSLFGSVLTDEFRPDSDVDVLVVFEPGAPWSLMDIVSMKEELQSVFGRETDIVEKKTLKNPFRRDHILKHHQVIYAA